MGRTWISTAPYGSAYWAARSPMGANLARMGYWDYTDAATGVVPPASSGAAISSSTPSTGAQIASATKTGLNAAKTGIKVVNTAANAALTNDINNLDMANGDHVTDLANTPSANLASSYLGGGMFNPNIYDPAFSTGTSVSSDLANIGDEAAATQSGSAGSLSNAAPYLKAGAGALGFGLSAYDLMKNGVSPENFGGMMSGGLAAASPWLAGAGPAAAVIALPIAFKSIFGHKHKAPSFNDNIEDITPFRKDDAGNVYMKMPGHGDIFRYNPTTNRYQVEGHRGGETVVDDVSLPTYGGHWEDLPVYEHNGQYYLRPSGGTWDDFYNISPISEYTQASVIPNDNLDNIYNSYIDASRTQQEADNIWNNMYPQDTESYI